MEVSFVGNFQFLASLFIDDFLLLSHVQNNSGLIQVYFIVATVALSGKFEQRWLLCMLRSLVTFIGSTGAIRSLQGLGSHLHNKHSTVETKQLTNQPGFIKQVVGRMLSKLTIA